MTEPLILLDPDDDPQPLPWQVEALCAQTDPEAFFPEKGGSTRSQTSLRALRREGRLSVLRAGS